MKSVMFKARGTSVDTSSDFLMETKEHVTCRIGVFGS